MNKNFKQRTYIGIFIVIGLLLIYTRFVNLNWGLPYPFHPDERNMAIAVSQLTCTGFNTECFNPHFFAYGQFPLYIGYILIALYHFLERFTSDKMTDAFMSLRIVSAVSSVLTFVVLYKLTELFFAFEKKGRLLSLKSKLVIASILFIFSPFFIQFSHFGTTESLLMLFYTTIIYLVFLLDRQRISLQMFVIFSAIICGLSLGTKVSSALFVIIPFLYLLFFLYSFFKKKKYGVIVLSIAEFCIIAGLISFISSPHNFLSFNEFYSSIRYESQVGTGALHVFYTRQFEGTIPIIFQILHIFPYVLGWPVFLLFLSSLFLLPWKKDYIFLRIFFLVFFLPNAFFYAKWTRFIAPVFPIALFCATIFLIQIYDSIYTYIQRNFRHKRNSESRRVYGAKAAFIIITYLLAIPGMAFLSVYTNQDPRFVSSDWIYKNIPNNSYILSETANVTDLPSPPSKYIIPPINYRYISFDFYNVDQNLFLLNDLKNYVSSADYIFMPSRRVFENHTCLRNSGLGNVDLNYAQRCAYLKQTYPVLNEYYEKLFNGALGFHKVAEFSNYPKIQLFGKTLVEFHDEDAEETWTVFDHPVIRIYKR